MFRAGLDGELIEGNLIGVDVTQASARWATRTTASGSPARPTARSGAPSRPRRTSISANGGDGLSLTVGPATVWSLVGQLYRHRPRRRQPRQQGQRRRPCGRDDVTIGGTAAGAGNVIAYNAKARGFTLVFSVDDNSFLSNSIYNNGDLGINLGNGPTPTPTI